MPHFDSMEWYQKLLHYGIDADTAPNDPDHNLVPRLVDKLVVPVVLDAVRFSMDCLSSAQVQVVASAAEEVMAHLEGLKDGAGAEQLSSGVLEMFQRQSGLHTWCVSSQCHVRSLRTCLQYPFCAHDSQQGRRPVAFLQTAVVARCQAAAWHVCVPPDCS